MDNQPLDGLRALVTGASTGIGKAIAIELASAGADVAINYCNNPEGADEVAAIVRGLGRRALTLGTDVGDPQQVIQMFAVLRQEWGAVDILVNNAGISPVMPFLDYSTEHIMKVLATNLTGALLCSQEALREMVQAHWGRIINISSLHSMTNNPGRVPYAASKGGMNAMTRALAVEFGPEGITTNCLVVGAVGTERTLSDPRLPEQLEAWAKVIPAGRWGTSEEIARMVVFLADRQSSFINGACITIDGGHLSVMPHP